MELKSETVNGFKGVSSLHTQKNYILGAEKTCRYEFRNTVKMKRSERVEITTCPVFKV